MMKKLERCMFYVQIALLILLLLSLGVYHFTNRAESNTINSDISVHSFLTSDLENVTIENSQLHFLKGGEEAVAYTPLSLEEGDGIKVKLSCIKLTGSDSNSISVDLCAENYDSNENQIDYTAYGKDGEKFEIEGVIYFGDTYPKEVNLRIFTSGSIELIVSKVEVTYIKHYPQFHIVSVILLSAFCFSFIVFLIFASINFLNNKESNSYPQNRRKSIDIAKTFALLFVSWSHFVSIGTNANTIQGIIEPGAIQGTLIPDTGHKLWVVESFLCNRFGIQFAIVGVVIFFIASGYFIPDMLAKYSNGLIIHSVKKIYPTLIICIALDAILVLFSSGIIFSPMQYITTALGIALPLGIVATVSAVWYIEVLLMIYLFSSIIKDFEIKHILFYYALTLMVIIGSVVTRPYTYGWVLHNMSYLLQFGGICILGVLLGIVRKEKWYKKAIWILFYFGMMFYNIVLYQNVNNESSGYGNINTYIAAVIVFAVSILLDRLIKNKSKYLIFILDKINRIFLPFYLLHISFGFTAMWILKEYHANSYLIVATAYCFSIGVSLIVETIITKAKGFLIKKIGK